MGGRGVSAGVSAVAIALGSHHSCVIVSGGGVKCWGWNKRDYAQLGIGNTSIVISPTDVPGDRPLHMHPYPIASPMAPLHAAHPCSPLHISIGTAASGPVWYM